MADKKKTISQKEKNEAIKARMKYKIKMVKLSPVIFNIFNRIDLI